MGDDVVSRPEYELHMRAGLAEAANLLAAEAAAQQVAIERPFNGLRMRARPGATGAQVVVDWYYDLGCARETRQRQERDALRARAEAAEQRAEAAERELAQARADARVLLAECYSADVADGGDFFGSAGMLAQAGMTRSEMAKVRMLPVSGDDPAGLLAVIRRTLGGAA